MDRKIKVAGTRSADDVLVAIIGRLRKDLPPNMFNDYQLMQFAEQHVHKMVKFSGSHTRRRLQSIGGQGLLRLCLRTPHAM